MTRILASLAAALLLSTAASVLTRLAGPQRRSPWAPQGLIIGYAALLIGFGLAGYFGTGVLADDPVAVAALAGLL